MRLSEALKEKQFDVRLRDKYLVDKKITADELTNYESVIPDEEKTNNFQEIPVLGVLTEE